MDNTKNTPKKSRLMDNTKNTPNGPAACTSSRDDDRNLQEMESRPLLGLKLEMTEPLFAELEAKMAAATLPESSSSPKKSKEAEKLKASNFPISSISVGAYKRVHTQEGELTAKLYFAKRKLVWEFLDGQLKSKMEVVWSDIIAIRALMLPNQPGLLEIELSNPPLFFRELPPQPGKHTTWQQTSDFTGGQATLFRRHSATFPPGALDKHYENLLRSDEKLLELSKRPFPSQRSLTTGTVLSFNTSEEQTLLFHHQPPLHYPTASSLPPPLYPVTINPTITQELGFVNFSHTDEMASRNIQPTMLENQTINDFSNDAIYVNDLIYVNDHRHFYYDEPPSMAEEFASPSDFPAFYQDFNPMIPSTSTSYNNFLDHKPAKMVQNNTVIDDHQHKPPPPPPHHMQMQECNYGVNQEFCYDGYLGNGDLSQILYSHQRIHKSPTDDVQHNHMDP